MAPSNKPIPPAARKELTVKQQRDARRAEKVAALKKKQATEKRNHIIAIVLGSVAVVAVVGLVITLVVTGGSSGPNQAVGDGDGSDIEGIETFEVTSQNHVEGTVDYAQTPPIGGDHAAVWLNCGIYEQPVPSENAVHGLEHSAIWVTYNPDDVAGEDLDILRDMMPSTYMILSPWPGLDSPVVASSWDAQLRLDGVDDPRLQEFIDAYWLRPDLPEAGALCTGGLDGEGRIS